MTRVSHYTFGPEGRPVLRRRLEEREASLSPYATRAAQSRGRQRPEPPCDMRTDFQRDRDRIIHSKAFRRLKHKTQVFLAPLGDHYVTRLTHTLEVAQIARTLARALNLNEDLVEAMALGHDLGHTPFGHLGEQVLDELTPGGFAHAVQSVRVVEVLEKDGHGLNLTYEVRQGILHHSKPRGDLLGAKSAQHEALGLEAQVCRISDAVAYLNHDIQDAVRAGVLREEELPQDVRRVLGTRHSQRIDTMVWDIVEASWPATGEVELPPGAAPVITMSPRVRRATNVLREFLFERVYHPASQGPQGECARRVMALLHGHYSRHPEELPAELRLREEPVERLVVDYLAGMTDQFALRTAERIQPGVTRGVFPWAL